MSKLVPLALIGVGVALVLKSRSASAQTSLTHDEEDEGGGQAPTQGAGLTPNLCTGNARRRDMENAHSRNDLVVVESYGSPERLIPEAARAFNALLRAARAAGFGGSLFSVVSGYRSRASQERLFAAQIEKQRRLHPTYSEAQLYEAARVWVAPPGSSDHETGCAVDLWLGYGISSANNDLIRGTAAYRWLVDNAWRFGFCPYEKEAWHWKYIRERSR